MTRKTIASLMLSTGLMLVSTFSFAYDRYDARIGHKEILTPAPAAAPAINGPRVYGARPGKKFLYRIPTQGVRPIKFTVKGLPEGLQVNEEGIISGVTPAVKGEYKIRIKAKNSYGKDEMVLRLMVGDKLALTPPTGWNTWGGYMLTISDELIRNVADFFVESGLADVGYQFIGLDDCWMRISPEMYKEVPEQKLKQHEGFDYGQVIGETRDAQGRILPNSRFPDMKALVDHVHSKGLKVGIYSTPGKATCQRWAGSYQHERQDAETYAEWGIDLLKYDLCTGGEVLRARRAENPAYTQAEFWSSMVNAIEAQDRDIIFNLCQYGGEKPWTWAPQIGVESWRCTGDLNHHVENYFKSALTLATKLRDYAFPGQWNDPDFMYIDRIKDVKRMAYDCVEIPLNTNQRYQYVTLWSMICAPYFFSCNIEMMDEFTLRLLSNAGLMNINQDELGQVAQVIRNDEKVVVMLKELVDGSKALAVFNRDADQEAVIPVAWKDLGCKASVTVKDVWRGKELGTYKEGIDTRLSPDGVALYLLEK